MGSSQKIIQKKSIADIYQGKTIRPCLKELPTEIGHSLISALCISRDSRGLNTAGIDAVVVAVRLIFVVLVVHDICSALDVVDTSKEFVHLLQRNALGLWNEEVHVENKKTIDTGKHWVEALVDEEIEDGVLGKDIL